MSRLLLLVLGVLFFLALGQCVVGQEEKVGEFKLNDGRTIKGSFDDKLLTIKSDSDEKGTAYWIVSSNSVISVSRAFGEQKAGAAPHFILKNKESHLIFMGITSAMMQKPGAEAAILAKLQSDYENPPPTEGVYLTFITIDGKREMVPANSFRGAFKDTTTVKFVDSSIKVRSVDGKTIMVPVTQLLSFAR